ncbi:hypothetical protein BOTBODRAFT_178936 [Botryobasidium botryosum FD-172 SS1]|uniref:cystathionine beta-synthase n=1 Tax=Botryobasidium botryosum (strain FD-172 SS1) TaxID=930990 RepID=A0A067M1A7_BOTB1|nr:hypothetical protein BOTBODRAFT_178936 [Botryobasidium botryosum FD-172 SS1]
MTTSNHPFAGRVLDSALDAIGNTPLIRMDRIAKAHNLQCNLYGKVEYFNAGGSIKDRAARCMLEAAEREGILTPGKSVLIECSAGNAGMALAMMGCLKGYRTVIVMPDHMSTDKDLILRALGAEVVRAPDPAPKIVARKLAETIPSAVMLDQFANPNNPLAHELTTAPEIIAAIESIIGSDRPTSGKVDVVCASGGSGGTLTGVARGLRKLHNPDVKVIGSDSMGSVLAQPDTLNDSNDPICLEGAGLKFVPENLDRSCVSKWIKVTDAEGFGATVQIHRLEGLLVGGSSGAIVAGVLKYLKSDEGWKEFGGVEGKNVVALLPDGIRNYLTQEWLLNSFSDAVDSPYANEIEHALKFAQGQGSRSVSPPIASLVTQDKNLTDPATVTVPV